MKLRRLLEGSALRPIASVRIALAVLLALVSGAAPLTAQMQAPVAVMERPNHYFQLDNIEGSWVGFNEVPIRPMFYDETTLELFALNVHDSTLNRFNAFGPPSDTWRLPWNPRSLAPFTTHGPNPTQRILVVCGGSFVLAALERSSGRIVDVLPLPAEPADLIVDQAAGRAFVSCTALDQVVEVDLTGTSMALARTFAIPSKHPLFLAFEPGPAKNVLVTPLVSGNNSICDKPIVANLAGTTNTEGPRAILDLEQTTVAQNRLKDHDLFRLERASGAVVPLGTDVGTILFGHGWNAGGNGRYWILNTEANNKGLPGKKAIQGEVVFNRVSIYDGVPTGLPAPAKPWKIVELDDADSTTAGIQYDPTRTVGQPCALAFTPEGYALIAGLLTDNVTVLDAAGNWVTEFDLDGGAIPRALQYSPQHLVLFVYEWGLNKVSAYNFASAPIQKIWDFALGFDPAPAVVQQGRELFYDAQFSRHNNASCASCHVDGRSDGVAWNLGDLATDDKGPMVTQTLAGSAFTLPYHWRGDNDTLEDFNDAFKDLLGASRRLTSSDPMTPYGQEEFERFEAFALSIAPIANPNQHPERILDPSIQPRLRAGSGFVADSIRGRDLFGRFVSGCAACHALPHGTSNEITKDNPSQVPIRNGMKVAAFNELWRKEPAQNIEELIMLLDASQMPEPPRPYPPTGFGLAHSGNLTSLHNFVQLFDTTHTPQQIADITAFVHVFDSGIAPAVHAARVLTSSNHVAVGAWLNQYLIPQANKRNCDVVAFGEAQIGTGVRKLAWTYDRSAGTFLCEDSSVPNQALGFFVSEAQAGRSNTFLGVPVGMGERFGVDADEDDFLNEDELLLGTGVYVADTDLDTFPDGHEVKNSPLPTYALNPILTPIDMRPPTITRMDGLFATARQGRVVIETDEPTLARVDYDIVGMPGTQQSSASFIYSKRHNLVLRDLIPSTLVGSMGVPLIVYQGSVSVTDHGGNPVATTTLPPFGLNGFKLGGALPNLFSWFFSTLSDDEVVINALSDTVVTRTGNSITIRLDAQVDRLRGGPPAIPMPGYYVVARVFVNGVLSTTFTSVDRHNTILLNNTLYTRIPGPYLAAPTNAVGLASSTVTVGGLFSNDVVTIDIEFVDKASGSPLNFPVLGAWSLPHSKKDDLIDRRQRRIVF